MREILETLGIVYAVGWLIMSACVIADPYIDKRASEALPLLASLLIGALWPFFLWMVIGELCERLRK